MKELMSQQEQSLNHLRKWKVGALFMEAGTGKTRVACELIKQVPDADLILWLAPLQTIRPKDGILSVKDEIAKWDCGNMPFHFVGVESISASDRIYLDTMERLNKAKKPFIVVDESLKIKNWDAKRTKRILLMGRRAEYKLILNGTPLSRNLLDLWSQMEFLSPKILKMTYNQYKNTFCKYTTITKVFPHGGRMQKEFITGYENIDYLYSLIRHYVYQCDLHLNVRQNYRDYYYEIDEGTREQYYYLKERFLDDEIMEYRNNNIFLEMTQKMQHLYCCDESKFKVVDKLFKEIPEEKTIIFCKYIDSQEACKARYPKAQVLSYQKESFGLNMQDYNHTIYFDKIWDYALRIQSGRRTFRTGQEQDCFYYDLTGNVGLEQLIDRNIEKKISMSEYFKMKTIEDLRKEL